MILPLVRAIGRDDVSGEEKIPITYRDMVSLKMSAEPQPKDPLNSQLGML